jgi:ATP-binding cassette subfamily F protein 3
MPLVSLAKATYDYGRERILHGIDVAVEAGVKHALVGPNGAGKTTLLRAVAGELDLGRGQREATRGLKIGFLRQDAALGVSGRSERAVRDLVATTAFGRELELERELARLARELERAPAADHAALVERQGRLQTEFERLDGYTVGARLESALSGVGLRQEVWSQPPDRLSGGERRRAALAAVLLLRSDLLLLDEPTNHLDLESCEWLEDYLARYPGATVLVSHDRHFLDRLCTRTWQIERGRFAVYSGNYSFFDEQRRLRYQQQLAAWENQQAQIRQAEDYIARNIAGQKTRQAQSRRKQLAKLERIEKPPEEPGLLRFDLAPLRPSGATVLQAEGVCKRYGARTLVAGFDLLVVRGERIGIVGPNGCGKTTLLKLLAEIEVPDAGCVTRGLNVDLGLYDQELSGVAPHRTPLQELAAVAPDAAVQDLRSFLGAFGFDADLHDRTVGDLSGGQRSRLALLKLIRQGYNTLLLDEPTNHLDIRSRESLENALRDYAGTLIVVSHDRRFLDKLVSRLIVFPAETGAAAGQLEIALGNYADWVRRRALKEDSAAAGAVREPRGGRGSPPPRREPPDEAAERTAGRLSKNEQARRRSWIAEVEAEIAALEAQRDALVAEMGLPDLTAHRRLELGHRCAAIDADLAERLERWEQWSRELEAGGTS